MMGRAEPVAGPLKPFPLVSLSKLGLVCRRIHFPAEGSRKDWGQRVLSLWLPPHPVVLESGWQGQKHLLRHKHISCCLHAPEIKDSKSEPGSQPKYQKTHPGSHVHNLMPNLHAMLVYLNPSFPEDAVLSLIPAADGLHLPK